MYQIIPAKLCGLYLRKPFYDLSTQLLNFHPEVSSLPAAYP